MNENKDNDNTTILEDLSVAFNALYACPRDPFLWFFIFCVLPVLLFYKLLLKAQKIVFKN